MKLIGLAGAAGAGKDTMADIMIKEYDNIIEKVAFADPIREMFNVLMGQDIKDQIPRSIKSTKQRLLYGMTPRRWMQLCGTEFMREMVHLDIWIRLLDHRLSIIQDAIDRGGYGDLVGQHAIVIITDVRFPNEVEFITRNGVLIEMKRKDNPYAIGKEHESEGLNLEGTARFVMHNDGDLDDMYKLMKDRAPFVSDLLLGFSPYLPGCV